MNFNNLEYVHQTDDGPSSFTMHVVSCLDWRHGVLFPKKYDISMQWSGMTTYNFDIASETVTEMVCRVRDGYNERVAYEFIKHIVDHGAPTNLPFNSTARKELGNAIARLIVYHSAYMSKLPSTAMTDEIPEDLQ